MPQALTDGEKRASGRDDIGAEWEVVFRAHVACQEWSNVCLEGGQKGFLEHPGPLTEKEVVAEVMSPC
jgi:hypothetical protein